MRRSLSIDEAADIIWATNGPEFYTLMVIERGWNIERFEAFLADAWVRLLLEDDRSIGFGSLAQMGLVLGLRLRGYRLRR